MHILEIRKGTAETSIIAFQIPTHAWSLAETTQNLENSIDFQIQKIPPANPYYMPGQGQPGALELPHMQGPGRGPTIWCIVRSLTLFYTRDCFQDLNP